MLNLSFRRVDTKEQTQLVRLGRKCLHLLVHLASLKPCSYIIVLVMNVINIFFLWDPPTKRNEKIYPNIISLTVPLFSKFGNMPLNKMNRAFYIVIPFLFL